MKPKTRQIVDALRANGWPNVEWTHTGGGCYAIALPLGDRNDFSEVLITGDDVLIADDWYGDEYLDGVWYVVGYDREGDALDGAEWSCNEAGDWPMTLAEIVAVVDAMAAMCGERA